MAHDNKFKLEKEQYAHEKRKDRVPSPGGASTRGSDQCLAPPPLWERLFRKVGGRRVKSEHQWSREQMWHLTKPTGSSKRL